jgi:AraC-like DNA-binding protein
MHPGFAPRLERYRIFHCRRVEEAHAFAERVECRFDFGRGPTLDLDLRVNGIYLTGSYIGYVQYGPEATVVIPAGRRRRDFWLQVPVRGGFEVTNRAGSVTCAPGRGVISCPKGHVNRSRAGSARINLSITSAAIEGQLASLLGDLPNKTLDFAPEVDLTSGYGRDLASYLMNAVSDMEHAGLLLRHPITSGLFEQFIMTALLLAHPHSYSDVLQRLEKSIAPRDVKRATDYIEAHIATPFTVADVVHATGVAGRTLFKHFKSFKGISPMRYAQNVRFQRVRQALLRAEPEEKVTDIAMSWGFTHMGRFSTEYRRRFGESPSQTLKKRRRSPP